MPSIIDTLRQRLSVFSILTWVLTLGVVYALTDNPGLVVGIALAAALTEPMGLLREHPRVDERWVKAGAGALLAVGATVWLALEPGGSAVPEDLLFPVLGVLGGLWLVLDARVDFREGRRFEGVENADDLDAGEAMVVMQHARLIGNELEAGPRTVPELAAACDLTESRVREAIEIAGDDGTIYPVDPEAEQPRYALDERRMGASGLGLLAVGGLRDLAARLARPVLGQF
jgi:hypothetical protein